MLGFAVATRLGRVFPCSDTLLESWIKTEMHIACSIRYAIA
ncbi:hypothetical protein [Calothrix sp. PCC 6303]|nr:hypothetical protein [Calothrix sp. PCC 6303]